MYLLPSNFSGFIGVILSISLLSACGPQGGAINQKPTIDQDNICETADFGVAKNCTPGQKIIFLPQQFGNEQLPVFFAAANCDLRFSVVLTKGAVTCIFQPMKPKEHPASETSPPASAPKN
jgi:hypothetical protein